jgi:hypothetical protein
MRCTCNTSANLSISRPAAHSLTNLRRDHAVNQAFTRCSYLHVVCWLLLQALQLHPANPDTKLRSSFRSSLSCPFSVTWQFGSEYDVQSESFTLNPLPISSALLLSALPFRSLSFFPSHKPIYQLPFLLFLAYSRPVVLLKCTFKIGQSSSPNSSNLVSSHVPSPLTAFASSPDSLPGQILSTPSTP